MPNIVAAELRKYNANSRHHEVIRKHGTYLK